MADALNSAITTWAPTVIELFIFGIVAIGALMVVKEIKKALY